MFRRRILCVRRVLGLSCIAMLLTPCAALAVDYTIKAGSTNVSVFFVVPGNDFAPDTVSYQRDDGMPQNLTIGAAHSSGDKGHVDNKWFNFAPFGGSYVCRYDLPDAVCAAGASNATISLVNEDNEDSNLEITFSDTAPVVTNLNTGYTTLTQYMIPRFADGTTHPAGHLRGYGPKSVIRGNLYGPSDGSNPQEIVVTEDYASTVNYWTNGNLMGAQPAVLQAEVRDLTIAGKDDLENGYGSGGVVNDQPHLNPVSTHKNREIGLYFQSAGALVENVRFFHIAGTCCYIKSPGGLDNLNGALQPFDREKTTVRDVWCLRAYTVE